MNAMLSRAALALSLCAVLTGCARHELPTATIQVGELSMKVELAAEPSQRNKGLMLRDSLPANEGMLFLYPDEAPREFWMKNTRIPLSIAYIDRTGKIVRIADMKPLDTHTTKSLYPAMYALEVNRGWFEAHGVDVGTMITRIPDVDAS